MKIIIGKKKSWIEPQGIYLDNDKTYIIHKGNVIEFKKLESVK